MKANLTEQFYEKYQNVLFEKYRKECDFEYRLKIKLMGIDFQNLPIPEEAREKAESIYIQMQAKEVYDTAKAELIKKMHSINDLKAGRASLGYTTVMQGVSAMHDLVEEFEFSCFMLAKFKKKYGIEAQK